MKYRGKLIKGCYVDDKLGMAWAIHELLYQTYNDVQKLNEAVNQINTNLQSLPHAKGQWLATLGLHRNIWINEFDASWKGIFQAKAHIFLYESQDTIMETDPTLPVLPVFGEPDFLWVSDKEVWTPWDGDHLNERFQGVPVPAADPVDPGTGVVIPTASDSLIHMTCPYCGKIIF